MTDVRESDNQSPPALPTPALSGAAVVDFPLRGEWLALNTPARRVPSHGTDFFGQRYALDFARTDGERLRFQRHGLMRHLVPGVSVSRFFAWDQPVYAAFAGEVILALDGWNDRTHVSALWELARARFAGPSIRGTDYRPLTGNCVFVQGEPGVAVYAHLRRDSVIGERGQKVAAGEQLGTVGNSGNTTMPHLHFHLMDGPDPLQAKGVPCVFASYERWIDGAWEHMSGGIPGHLERVRSS